MYITSSNLLLAIFLSGIFILIKYLVFIFISVFSGNGLLFIKKNDWKSDIFSFSILTIFLYIVLELYSRFGYISELFSGVIFSVVFATVPIIYNYVVHPVYYLLNQRDFQVGNEYQNWIDNIISKKINVRIINKDVLNAYATGLVPFLKIILVGKPMVRELSEDEMKCLLLHEVGHSELNHLRKLFLANLFYVTIYVLTTFIVFPYLRVFEYEHLFVGIYAGIILGGGSLLFLGIIQRKLEKDADLYAAKIMGSDKYYAFLIKLNLITQGGLEKWAINYPNLTERLANVGKL
ncbi:M48 family metalloprotease [Aquirufa ecclesiirivi]|uniref:M48 family metalloprotease n=1 Tax=Aquirufa ecclesiirivi TaxID=2715124 RepID=UPI0022A83680|nr:M48 family metalloprotease [Aquirufa ecclesiirivi]MCZ2473689.1 M48 family metalloprotease [Aquirufa ecclesiirivi]